MRVVAIVPAKGNSERINAKNLRVLDGEYLVKRKLRQLLACDVIDEVYLDTESDEIISICGDLAVRVLKRDPMLASNSTDGHELFENGCRQIPGADIYIQCLCTAPFVNEDTIKRALKTLVDNPQADSLVAVTSSKFYTWTGNDPDYGRGRIPNSVNLPVTTVEAMSLYMMQSSAVDFPVKRFGRNPVFFPLTPTEAIDINNEEDLYLAEEVCAGRRMREVNFFNAIKSHLTSSMLSDLTKDLGFSNCALPDSIRPMVPGRILGRAKTLKLTALDNNAASSGSQHGNHSENDKWKGIYDALRSYAFLRTGDVIVVSTEVKDRAYFGDLNAHLAVRSGCHGVIVDGLTRDVDGVSALGLPVYAHGRYCRDIKYEGTTEAMNRQVQIGDVLVGNGDVIFADGDGVVCIPATKWDAILNKAIELSRNEASIKINAALGLTIDELLKRFGYF